MNDYPGFSPEQQQVLLRPIKPGRVVQRDGNSNLEAYDVRAHLSRLFGHGRWDEVAHGTMMLYEDETTLKNGKPGYKVGYIAHRSIVVRDQAGNKMCEHHGSAVGEAQMPEFKRGDAHDFAVKKAQSQALKRAAINLGDQFGLSLYAKGSTGPVVGRVVGATDDDGDGLGKELHEPDVVEEVDPDTGSEHEEEAGFVPDAGMEARPAVRPDPEPVPPSPTLPLETPGTDTDVPIPPDPQQPDPEEPHASDAQVRKIVILMGELEIKERKQRISKLRVIVGRPVESTKDLTRIEAHRVIEAMEAERAGRADP